jgi:hypothetical protein
LLTAMADQRRLLQKPTALSRSGRLRRDQSPSRAASAGPRSKASRSGRRGSPSPRRH